VATLSPERAVWLAPRDHTMHPSTGAVAAPAAAPRTTARAPPGAPADRKRPRNTPRRAPPD